MEGTHCLLVVNYVLGLLQKLVESPHPLGPDDQVDVIIVDVGLEPLDDKCFPRIIHLGMDVAEALF